MSGKTGKAEKAQKSSWFKGMKAEFKKIVWPDKNTLAKQTAAVVIAVSYTHLTLPTKLEV